MKGPIAKLSMHDIVVGFNGHGHNLQDYICSLTDAQPEAVARYVLREENGQLCVYYVTADEDRDRANRWQQLVDLLLHADALQQELLGTDHPTACEEFHTQLNTLADEFADWAQEEGYALDDH
jgi:hypothetical protein